MIICIIAFFVLVSLVYGSREDVTNKQEDDNLSDREKFRPSYFISPIATVFTTTPRPDYAGPLYDFIVNICKAITQDFSNYKIPRYMKILSRSLKGLGVGFLMKMTIRKFAKTLNKLSIYRGKWLRRKVEDFLKIVSDDKPRRRNLFKTLNSIYTTRQDVKMDEYVYRLKRYGQNEKRRIRKRTREIFRKTVFDTIKKQKDFVKTTVQFNFALAMIEYLEGRTSNITKANRN